MADNVTILRRALIDKDKPRLMPDQFILPQSYCSNGVPECDRFGAFPTMQRNSLCQCTCNRNKSYSAALNFVNKVGKCWNDTFFRGSYDPQCTLHFGVENNQSGIMTFQAGTWEYLHNLDSSSNARCFLNLASSRILNCDNTWSPWPALVDRLYVALEEASNTYYLAALKADTKDYREICGKVMKLDIRCRNTRAPFGLKNYCVLLKFAGSITCPFTSGTEKRTTLLSKESEITRTEGTTPSSVHTSTETVIGNDKGERESCCWFPLNALIGGVAGLVILVSLAILAIVICTRTKKRTNRKIEVDGEQTYEEPEGNPEGDFQRVSPQQAPVRVTQQTTACEMNYQDLIFPFGVRSSDYAKLTKFISRSIQDSDAEMLTRNADYTNGAFGNSDASQKRNIIRTNSKFADDVLDRDRKGHHYENTSQMQWKISFVYESGKEDDGYEPVQSCL